MTQQCRVDLSVKRYETLLNQTVLITHREELPPGSVTEFYTHFFSPCVHFSHLTPSLKANNEKNTLETNLCQIPFIIYSAFPLRGERKLEPIPAGFRWEAGFTLDRSLIHHRANTDTNNHSHSHLWDIKSGLVTSSTCPWAVGGNHVNYPVNTLQGSTPSVKWDRSVKRSVRKFPPHWYNNGL